MNLHNLREAFAQPPMEARPAPFWFWNDRLDPERLIWQFDRMIEAGMGGAVMHARGGLDVAEYLDERWFAGVEAVVKRAADHGALAWIYDELGWPSGTAGGRIPVEHPEFRMVHLQMEDVVVDGREDPLSWENVVAAFRVTRTDLNRGYQRRHDGSGSLFPDRIRCDPIEWPVDAAAHAGDRLLIFRQTRREGALNYFDPAATAKFIEATHEEYYRRFAPYFGSTIRHGFMDEVGMFGSCASLPWDTEFAAEFEARRGYPLLPHLPALFFEVPGCEAVRFDFWSLCTEKLREGFGIPMDDWCNNHNIAYSGHYLCEATLKEAIRQLGSTMPLYEYQGLPGIDILGNDFYSRRFEQEAYSYYVVVIKQAASVVHQLAKSGLMSESYGVGGHAMGPEAMHAATNFQMALGVTYIVHHASFYSIRAQRKLDCPPFIDWREPYWPFFRKHLDEVGRTCWLLNQGEHTCDVLLLHPASSMQATFRLFRTRDEYKVENYLMDADMPFEVIDKHFCLMSSALLDGQIDHDYGDEEILARHGSVEDGRLRVGACTYPIVVLPPLVNLRSSTLALLREFAASGGAIVLAGSAPWLVDGRPSSDAAGLLNGHATRIVDGVDRFEYRWVIEELATRGARTVLLESEDGGGVPSMKAQRRRCGNSELLYLANISREHVSAHLTFTTGVNGRIEEWDPATGQIHPLAPCLSDRTVEVDLEWAPGQARILVAVPGEHDVVPRPSLREQDRLRPNWSATRNDPNVLVLDECEIDAADATPQRFPIHRARGMLQSRMEENGRAAPFTTRYTILVSETRPVSEACEVAIELYDGMTLSLNGERVALAPVGTMLDPSIKRVALPALRPGANRLEITASYPEAKALDSPWLAGPFRLVTSDNASFTLEADDTEFGLGSWPERGAPFYAGSVTYRAEVDLGEVTHDLRVMLELPGLAGSAQVRVNGEVVDHVLWRPYACDLSGAVRSGKNVVEIEVANTLRNLLGPLYEPREEIMTGMSDKSYQGEVGEPKRFRDYGLTAPPEIVVLST